MSTKSFKSLYVLAALLPLLTGAKGQGCAGNGNGAAIFSKSKAADMSGGWDVTYEDNLDIEITIGGAVYTKQLGPQGGSFTIDHDGQPITFDLDCSRPEVVCPSEVWPAHVSFRQDDPVYPHRVWMQVPSTECNGSEVEPDPSTCGPETNNPDCDKVCDGEAVTTTREAFGTVNESGDHLLVGLNATVASNGLNCIMIGGSVADADLTTEGSAETEDWKVTSGTGDVVTVFAGGCLWVGDPNMDGNLEALVLGGSIRLATAFSAKKN